MADCKSLLRSLLFRIRRPKLARLAGWHSSAAQRLEAQQFDDASALFHKILASAPDDVPALSGLAFIAGQQQDYAVAMQRWDDLVQRFPNDYWAAIGRANTLGDCERFTEAEAAFQQVLVRWPQRREGLSGHAYIAHRQRRFAVAIQRWETVLQHYPEDDWATLNLALDLMDSAQYGRAERLMGELVRRCGNDLAALSGYAEIAFRAGRYGDSLRRWDTVLEQFPEDYAALIGSALALLKCTQFAAAEHRFQQALDATARDVTSLSRYPAVLIEAKRFDSALEAWERIAALYPDNARVSARMGDTWFERGDYARAVQVYQDAQERWPGNLEAYHSHARLLEKQRREQRFAERCALARQRREGVDCGGFIVCEQRRFMFVVIAGNASTALKRLSWSLENSLSAYSARHPDEQQLEGFYAFSDDQPRRISVQQARQPKYADYLKFAVYRDPFERLLALYNETICPNRLHTSRGKGYFQEAGIIDAELSEFVDFAVAELRQQDPLRQDEHLRSQSLFYNPDDVDWIVPIKQLDAFLLTELDLSLARSAELRGCQWSLNATQTAMVETIYARDFILADCNNVYKSDGKALPGQPPAARESELYREV